MFAEIRLDGPDDRLECCFSVSCDWIDRSGLGVALFWEAGAGSSLFKLFLC